jgi:hypothetical protein
MKAYVISREIDAHEGWLVDIRFGPQPSPQSRYASRSLAQADCSTLNGFVICCDVSHHCSFTVDELPDGTFGIICVCHPH